jgi:hypothetical protein
MLFILLCHISGLWLDLATLNHFSFIIQHRYPDIQLDWTSILGHKWQAYLYSPWDWLQQPGLHLVFHVPWL